MAVAAVSFVGAGRQVDAESTTGWNAGNLDGDIKVQGSNAVGAKVSNTTSDFYDVNASNLDFSSGGANEGEHIFAWLNTLTPVSLHAIIAVEDAATDAVACWNVGPPAGYGGGWISYVVDPATQFDTIIAAGTPVWTTSGNPAQLTNVDGFGGRHTTSTSIMGNFNNALVDAVSVGYGYRVTNGDGASADAIFADFITYEQNSTNRYGALRSDGGILFALGQIRIGAASGATNTEFTDDGFTVVWIDAPVASTFYELRTEKGTGTTTVVLNNGTLRAELTTQAGLPLMHFAGSTSTTITNVNIIGARAFNLDGNVTITDGTWEAGGQIDLGGQPTISGLTVLDPASDRAMLINAANEMANVSNVTFDGAGIGGTTADSAIEVNITAAGPHTITLNGIKFQNRISGSVDMYFVDQGADRSYTVNITGGGDTPTYTKQRAGDTVTISNNVSVTFTGMKDNTEVRIYDSGTGTEIDGIENATAGTTDNRSFAWTDAASNVVDYVIHNNTYETIRVEGYTVPASATSIPIQQRLDRNYSNP